MVIENLHREEKIEGSSDRMFGLVMAAFFGLLGLWPLWSGGAVRFWALAVAALFLTVALLLPSALAILNRLWMRLGLLLNRIVSPIALGIVFLLSVLPVGLMMRALGKDPLRLKRDPSANSYWIPRDPPGPDPKTMNHLF